MSLKELVEKQKQEELAKTKDEVQVKEHVEAYKKMVEVFYQSVLKNWLEDINEEGLMKFEYQDMTINEEQTGEYHINSLVITMANIRILFRPIGTFLIGTTGRIDMYVNGTNDPSMFIIAGAKATSPRMLTQSDANDDGQSRSQDSGELVWKFVDKNNKFKYVSLDTNSFQQIVMSQL